MYLIEQTKDSDYETIFKLMKTNMYLMQSDIGLKWDQKEIENSFRNKSNYCIYRNGNFAAFLSLDVNEFDIFIHTLQVKDIYQNAWVGYAAFRHISKLAKDHNVSKLKCCVFENNPARHMYKKLGFKEISKEDKIFEIELELDSIQLRGFST